MARGWSSLEDRRTGGAVGQGRVKIYNQEDGIIWAVPENSLILFTQIYL